MEERELTLELTPVGGLRFKRGDKAHNAALRELLLEVMEPDEVAALESFFAESEGITVLEGEETFCG